MESSVLLATSDELAQRQRDMSDLEEYQFLRVTDDWASLTFGEDGKSVKTDWWAHVHLTRDIGSHELVMQVEQIFFPTATIFFRLSSCAPLCVEFASNVYPSHLFRWCETGVCGPGSRSWGYGQVDVKKGSLITFKRSPTGMTVSVDDPMSAVEIEGPADADTRVYLDIHLSTGGRCVSGLKIVSGGFPRLLRVPQADDSSSEMESESSEWHESTSSSQGSESSPCYDCMTQTRTVHCMPCGHRVYCEECKSRAEDRGITQCPECGERTEGLVGEDLVDNQNQS